MTEIQKTRRAHLEERLAAYYAKELALLEDEAVRAYRVGGANAQYVERYELDLAAIRKAIADLENEIAKIDGRAAGRYRRTMRAIPGE
jgi:hypothetical protein